MRKNRFFTNPVLEVLLDQRRWWLVSTRIRCEVQPVEDPNHRKWMRDHSHSHAHTEIMMVLKGQGRMGYEGQVYPYGPGSIFYFAPGESHDLEIPEWGHEAEMLWIVLMGRKFVARVTKFHPDLPRGGKSMGYLVMAEDSGLLATNPLADPETLQQSHPDVRALLMYAGVGLLVSALINHGDEDVTLSDLQVRQRVVRMMQEHMEETGGQELTPAEVARMSGYSKSHFMREFRQQVGCTVQEYLDDCRLRRAHELQSQGYKQYLIAERLGFSSPASYSRWRRQQEERRERRAAEEQGSGEVRARIL